MQGLFLGILTVLKLPQSVCNMIFAFRLCDSDVPFVHQVLLPTEDASIVSNQHLVILMQHNC